MYEERIIYYLILYISYFHKEYKIVLLLSFTVPRAQYTWNIYYTIINKVTTV